MIENDQFSAIKPLTMQTASLVQAGVIKNTLRVDLTYTMI